MDVDIVNKPMCDLDQPNLCVLCADTTITASYIPNYLCKRCFRWAEANGWLNEPWLNALMSMERGRRQSRDTRRSRGVQVAAVPFSRLSDQDAERFGLS